MRRFKKTADWSGLGTGRGPTPHPRASRAGHALDLVPRTTAWPQVRTGSRNCWITGRPQNDRGSDPICQRGWLRALRKCRVCNGGALAAVPGYDECSIFPASFPSVKARLGSRWCRQATDPEHSARVNGARYDASARYLRARDEELTTQLQERTWIWKHDVEVEA